MYVQNSVYSHMLLNPAMYSDECAHFAVTGDPDARLVYDSMGWDYSFVPESDADKEYLLQHWVSYFEGYDKMASVVEVRAFAELYQLPMYARRASLRVQPAIRF